MPNSGSMEWTKAVENALGGKSALTAALSGAPGAGNGALTVHRYEFGTDILSKLVVGDAAFTPAVGDLLYDAWIDVDEAWDGTTPTADIAQDPFLVTSGGSGLFSYFGGGPFDLTDAGTDWGGVFVQNSSNAKPQVPLLTGNVHLGSPVSFGRGAPFRFTTDDPLKVYVTQDGSNSGVSPGSTHGQASLYVVTATPVDPRMH